MAPTARDISHKRTSNWSPVIGNIWADNPKQICSRRSEKHSSSTVSKRPSASSSKRLPPILGQHPKTQKCNNICLTRGCQSSGNVSNGLTTGGCETICITKSGRKYDYPATPRTYTPTRTCTHLSKTTTPHKKKCTSVALLGFVRHCISKAWFRILVWYLLALDSCLWET